ncbi:hypothetical protein BDV59DRAFT_160082 [Aspergillus ambiguus]|uniref:uncharacterized protein n=1 Tax=Aspergillus ambiguus TaxID=176160 RepID=UPI003CCD6080
MRVETAWVIIGSIVAPTWARTCYHPNKVAVPGAVPCTDAEKTFCCAEGGFCMTNGYCAGFGTQPYNLYRGACTDQSWGSSCTQSCLEQSPNSGGPITCIGKNDEGQSLYCCGYQRTNNSITTCADGSDPFTMPDGQLIFGRAGLQNATIASDNSVNATTSCDATSGSQCTNATAVGAGVGVPLGVIAITTAIWAFWERRQRKKVVVASNMQAPTIQEAFMPVQDVKPVNELDGQGRMAELAARPS